MATKSGTIKVRGQMTAVFFFGDMPLSDEQLKNLHGYVGKGWCDVYASDIEDAITETCQTLGEFEVGEVDDADQ